MDQGDQGGPGEAELGIEEDLNSDQEYVDDWKDEYEDAMFNGGRNSINKKPESEVKAMKEMIEFISYLFLQARTRF